MINGYQTKTVGELLEVVNGREEYEIRAMGKVHIFYLRQLRFVMTDDTPEKGSNFSLRRRYSVTGKEFVEKIQSSEILPSVDVVIEYDGDKETQLFPIVGFIVNEEKKRIELYEFKVFLYFCPATRKGTNAINE